MSSNNPSEDRILTVYMLRHLQSKQNRDGYGPLDTPLTEEGKVVMNDISELIRIIGVDNIDEIRKGNLERHTQSFEELTETIDYKGKVICDERLNALVTGSFTPNDPRQTEREYDLKRFKGGSDGLYNTEIDGKLFSFDPVEMGIYPFDSLYSAAYIDRKLRKIVFPDDKTLTSFEDIKTVIKSFQKDLVNKAINAGKPINLITIGSCSPNAFNLEYSAFGTIGENIVNGYEGNIIFPQDHDEVMILGYDKKDKEQGRDRLHVINGNIKIKDYIKKLR